MKKKSICWIVISLIVVMLVGCSPSPNTPVPEIETPEVELPEDEMSAAETDDPSDISAETSTETETEDVPEDTEEDVVYEGDASSYYIDVAYTDQIARYYTALSEKWDEGKYFENDMSELPFYYYEGNPLENVGFGFADLDNDGHWELIIGAILNAEEDPAVFEIWTLVDGEPVMLAQGGSRNRYVLQYVEEDRMWYVVNEVSESAFNHVTYYLMLNEGKLEVVQGIMFDAAANEQNPWFMTYDLDGDVSNDMPVDEATANAILESHRKLFTAVELFPYSLY